MTDTFVQTASGKPTIYKDPSALLDYTEDWTDWLALISPGTRIASHTITPNGAMTVSSSTDDGLKVTAFLGGGVLGQTESVTYRITTDDTPPRTDERTLYFKIRNR